MPNTTRAWRISNWGLWGWIETGLKLIAVAIGIYALVSSAPASTDTLSAHPELGAVILLAVLSLFTVLVIGYRLNQGELISIAFAIANSLGHLSLFAALIRQPNLGALVLAFTVFMLLGDASKLIYLYRTGYTEGGRNTASMMRLVTNLMAVYVLLLVFIVL